MDVIETEVSVVVTTVSVAEAKRRFSDLIEAVARGEWFVVTRRGKPVMSLGPPEEADSAPLVKPTGLAAHAGAFADWEDFAETMAEIVASRRHAKDRPPPSFD